MWSNFFTKITIDVLLLIINVNDFFFHYLSLLGLRLKWKYLEDIVNPLRPGEHKCPLSPKFQFYFKKGSSQKFPTSVAPMSQ